MPGAVRVGVTVDSPASVEGTLVVGFSAGGPVGAGGAGIGRAGSAGGGAATWSRLSTRGSHGTEPASLTFWNEAAGCLYDVIDVNHEPGAVDPSVRPNQILAVGGLPLPLLDGEQARRVVDAVESRLLTPLGLRSLAPGSSGYVGRYAGGVRERDGAYHQGTVWPWLIGPFVEAWVRVRGATAGAKREARRRFIEQQKPRARG